MNKYSHFQAAIIEFQELIFMYGIIFSHNLIQKQCTDGVKWCQQTKRCNEKIFLK